MFYSRWKYIRSGEFDLKKKPKDRVMYMHIYRDINLIFLIDLFIFLIYIKQLPTTRTIK